jgi:hypothetical protein
MALNVPPRGTTALRAQAAIKGVGVGMKGLSRFAHALANALAVGLAVVWPRQGGRFCHWP